MRDAIALGVGPAEVVGTTMSWFSRSLTRLEGRDELIGDCRVLDLTGIVGIGELTFDQTIELNGGPDDRMHFAGDVISFTASGPNLGSAFASGVIPQHNSLRSPELPFGSDPLVLPASDLALSWDPPPAEFGEQPSDVLVVAHFMGDPMHQTVCVAPASQRQMLVTAQRPARGTFFFHSGTAERLFDGKLPFAVISTYYQTSYLTQ